MVQKLDIFPATEINDRGGFNAVIYGRSGSGKTTLAASAREVERGRDVLVVDIEGGTRSIHGYDHVDVFQPKTWSEVESVKNFLMRGGHSYKTIVIDSITEAQVLGLPHIMTQTRNSTGSPTLQDWGKSAEQLQTLVRDYRILSQTRGWNVIFTAQLQTEKDDLTGRVMRNIALTPAALRAVTRATDGIGLLEVDAKTKKRTLILDIQPDAEAKFRQPKDWPHQVPSEIEDPTMGKILNLMFGE